MKLKKPPKRIKKTIHLNGNENKRFIKVVQDMGYLTLIERFLESTGMYLRGRYDGDTGTKTEPCGYIFLDKLSFEKFHRQIAYFDPFPERDPLKLSFRRWNKILPFTENIWNNRLDDDDKCQRNMRVKFINNNTDLDEAIELATMARETFSNIFDLSISRVIK